jgi:glycosyltransferase involved in cell wall biosynthesis
VARGLINSGHRAIVISSGGRLVSDLERIGATHIERNIQSKNPITILQNAVWLKQLVEKEKIDILHTRSRAPAWSALIAAHKTNVPMITTYHAAYKARSAIKKYYNSVMVRGIRVIAISQLIKSHIEREYGCADKIRLILRGIDTKNFTRGAVTVDRIEALRNAWGVDSTTRLILLPARLSPIKGQDVAIKAMAMLRDITNLTLVIIGDDQGRTEYRQKLMQLISNLGLGARVKLVHHCAYMPAAYAAAHLVLAPSLVPEGFGRVPIEAMAMGIPVIASNSGGFAETIRDGENGWLAPTGDVMEWADKMRKIFAMPHDALAPLLTHAIAEVNTKYTTAKMVSDTLAVYAEVAR